MFPGSRTSGSRCQGLAGNPEYNGLGEPAGDAEPIGNHGLAPGPPGEIAGTADRAAETTGQSAALNQKQAADVRFLDGIKTASGTGAGNSNNSAAAGIAITIGAGEDLTFAAVS
jgi:hypothetical protein